MSAKVTVVVPIYNVEQYLPKCLDSLINQTFKDIEIWAISDGSPDNSVDIIKKYSKKDKRVKCIEKENGGYGSVLEYAIKNIKTEYFIICDPDDWLREDAIEKLYTEASTNNLDMVRGGFYFVYNGDMNEEYCDGFIWKDLFNPESKKVYKTEIERFLLSTVSPHAKLYKTSIAKGIEFPHKVSFTDMLLYTLFINKAKKVSFINEGLAYYLCDRPGNSVTEMKPKVFDDHYVVISSIFKQCNNGSKYFYYLIFQEWLNINYKVGKLKDKKDFYEKRELVYNLLEMIREYKKEILSLSSNHSIKEKIAYHLLLNKLSCRKMFIYESNKSWKRNHEKD